MIYFIAKGGTKEKKFKKIDMIVIRQSSGKLCESKCCKDCIKLMKFIGIRKVYYSNSNGKIICEKLCNISNNESTGRKANLQIH